MNRRKIRKYRNQRKNSGVKFLAFIGIMIVAVVCGYLVARFVIGPMLGYDTEVLKLDFPSKLTAFLDKDKAEESEKEKSDDSGKAESDAGKDAAENTTDEKTSDDKTADSGYALQFGLFSTEDGASERLAKLKDAGVDAQIKEVDGKYKIISPVVSTKDEAIAALQKIDKTKVTDVFITTVN